MKSVLTIIGTRPEAIKLAPFILAINKSDYFKNQVCVTRQHTDLLDQFVSDLGVVIDYQFEDHETDGSLHRSASHFLQRLEVVLTKAKPDIVVVQGDTTTTFTAALAAFYSRIPVVYVEAGLRTNNIYSPWPEEIHRYLASKLTTYFFAPTKQAKNALVKENIPPNKIWVVGNTSIDAVKLARKNLKSNTCIEQRLIVVTIHRRENHGKPLKEICCALHNLVKLFSDIKIVFILHPNPSVRNPVVNELSNIANIDLIDPLDHFSFIKLLNSSIFIITDSGGIQEEASFLGKPVLIARDTTERPEIIKARTARLVGAKSDDIIKNCRELLENEELLKDMSKVHFPYGDGYAAERIVKILECELYHK